MNPSALLKFRNLFEKQKKEMLESRTHAAPDLIIRKEEISDETDLAAIEKEQEFQLRMQKRNLQYLKKIDSALARIREGSYGVCDDCDEEISIRRLEVRPTTTLCLTCKESAERKEKTFASRSTPMRKIRMVAR